MSILASDASKGNLGGPFAMRTDDAPEQSESHLAGAGHPVGYDFDPLPSTIRRDILLRLAPIDHLVLAILISFAVWRRDSCWTTIRTIAARLRAIRPGRSGKPTVCERTVQRSLERLKAAGLIDHRRVPKPDPDQPDNRTGWRFYFLWPIEERPPVATLPREVTKPPGEVTKELPGAATPSREVTKESGDSIVTQGRGEVREQEQRTLNVAALAPGEGEDAPESAPARIATVEPPTAAEEPPPAAPASSPPTITRETAWTPAELAAKLVRRMRDSGRYPRVEPGPDGPDVIRFHFNPGITGIPPEMLAELVKLRPHVLACLKGGRSESATSGTPATTEPAARPATKVPPADQADVRSRLGRLDSPETTRADVAETARKLTATLGPHLDEGRTLATFVKWCGEVRDGRTPQAILQDAFEVACNFKGARSRGAVFTDQAVELFGKFRAEMKADRGRSPSPG